jgi:flagellar biosynthetic protein FliO
MDGVLSTVSVILICAVILVLAYLCSRFLGKTWNRVQKGRYLEVLDQVAVGQDRAIMIVRVKEQTFLVGSSSGGIQLISELNGEFETVGNTFSAEKSSTTGSMSFRDALQYNIHRYTGLPVGGKINIESAGKGKDSEKDE